MSDSSWPHGLQPTRFLCPWDFPGKNAGVGCCGLLQEAIRGFVLKDSLRKKDAGSAPLPRWSQNDSQAVLSSEPGCPWAQTVTYPGFLFRSLQPLCHCQRFSSNLRVSSGPDPGLHPHMAAGSGGVIYIVIPAVQRWKPRLRDPPVLSSRWCRSHVQAHDLWLFHGPTFPLPGFQGPHPALWWPQASPCSPPGLAPLRIHAPDFLWNPDWGVPAQSSGERPESSPSCSRRSSGSSLSHACLPQLPPPLLIHIQHGSLAFQHKWIANSEIWSHRRHITELVWGTGPPSLYEDNLLQSLLEGGEVGLYMTWGFHNELRAKLPGRALR